MLPGIEAHRCTLGVQCSNLYTGLRITSEALSNLISIVCIVGPFINIPVIFQAHVDGNFRFNTWLFPPAGCQIGIAGQSGGLGDFFMKLPYMRIV